MAERDATKRLPSRFRRLWAATAISNLGDGVRLTALPLLATELTSDPRLIAGVAVAEQVPWVVLLLPGGVLADRYDRRKLRVVLDLVRAAAMCSLAILIIADRVSIVAVFVVAALLTAAESIVDSSSMAIVPALVEEDQLEHAGGIMSATELIAGSLIGPALGGLLFGAAISIPFGFDAASFVLSAVVASTILGRFQATPESKEQKRSFRREVGEGFRWLWRHRLLRNLALVSTVLGFANLMYGALFVLFAREILGLGPIGFGLLLIPAAIGGVAGSLVAPRLKHLRFERVLAACVAISALAMIAIAGTTNPFIVAGLTAIESAAILAWNVLTVALRQRVIPDHLLGRVGSTYRFVMFIGTPFGALAGGIVAERTTIATAFVVAGCIQVAAAFVVLVVARPTKDADTAARSAVSI